MPRVLLLSTTTGYQTRSFGEAAERLSVELMLATDRCHVLDDPWRDAAVPVRFHDEEASAHAIVEASREHPIDALLALGDRPTVVAALAAEALGVPGHPPDGARTASNKRLTRVRLSDAGLPTPWFQFTSVDADPRALSRSIQYPCVIKPIALSGSRGVIRADDPAGFVVAFERLRRLLLQKDVRAMRNPANDEIGIEGFIEGPELAIEAILDRGALHALALFDKPDPLDGPFFEETIYVTPSSLPSETQAGVAAAVGRAATALGLHHGPVHAECRVNPRGVFVLEVAARPIGGLCAGALRFAAKGAAESISYEELLLRHALGEPIGLFARESAASGVMMIPIARPGYYKHVDGVEEARVVPGISDVRITAKPDQLMLPLPEGASYLGFIFARATAPGDVVNALKAAQARLRFSIEQAIPVA